MDPINKMFDRMDRWRHLPNYQLERRADLLFSLYLPDALAAKLGFAIRQDLIPEFPVRIGTIFPHIPINRSFKIDYLALSDDALSAVFVELKTEGQSRRAKQDKYLAAAKEVGLPALLNGLLTIFQATHSKRKYFCLLDQLAQMGLVQIPSSMYDLMHRTDLRGLSDAAAEIQVTCQVKEQYVIYVQPNGTDTNVISFDIFRRIVERHEDVVSKRFAQSLAEWSHVKAGRRPLPQCIPGATEQRQR